MHTNTSLSRRHSCSFLRSGFALALALLCLQTGLLSADDDAENPATPVDGNVPELDYRIGGGDVLQISVWKEADFSVRVTVRFDGKFTLPLAGDIEAAGRTPEELSAHLEEALTEYIGLPQVTVSVEEPNSARYFVIGRVGKQGAYPYTGPITVVQALALAEGFQEFAKDDKILVIREVDGDQMRLQVRYDRLKDGRDLSSNFPLQPGDTIVVP